MAPLCCIVNTRVTCPLCNFVVCRECIGEAHDDHGLGSLEDQGDVWYCPVEKKIMRDMTSLGMLEVFIPDNNSSAKSLKIYEQIQRSWPNESVLRGQT